MLYASADFLTQTARKLLCTTGISFYAYKRLILRNYIVSVSLIYAADPRLLRDLKGRKAIREHETNYSSGGGKNMLSYVNLYNC